MLSHSRKIKAIIPLHVTISFPGESLTFSADADDAFSKLQLQMIGAYTEFVRNIILKHQAEGIAKVKERGWIRTESVRLWLIVMRFES